MASQQRSITAVLRAEVGQYKRDMDEAAKATERVRQESEGIAKSSKEAEREAVRAARQTRENWSTVATPLLAVGGAVTAVGAAALKTGVEYNSLQQRVRAGLTTMLGSAEAVNAQMAQFDAFARNSPFSRQTFLTAQQQMLAFGIETQKVIPYLEAVQDAVAAAGGGEQQISEIAFIMSQISAASKLTAVDLMQFGQRGIDAAELIGSQMGKTGAQIRNDITAGALDADEALDALAAGMSAKFDGAAANVKNTWAGAVDRFKAAWRDFGAFIAEPFVGAEGGGLLVDLTNSASDLMRTLETLPAPLRATVSGLTGLAGVATLGAGAFLAFYPRVLDLKTSLDDMGVAGTRAYKGTMWLGRAGAWATTITATAIAVGQLAQSLSDVPEVGANRIGLALDQATESARSLDEVFSDFGGDKLGGTWLDDVDSLSAAFDRMFDKSRFESFKDSFSDLFSFTGAPSEIGILRDRFAEVDGEMARMVQSGNPGKVRQAWDSIVRAAREGGYSLSEVKELFPQYQDALLGLERSQDSTAKSAGNLSQAMQSAWDALADPSAAVQASQSLSEVIAAWQEQTEAAVRFSANTVEALRMGLDPAIIEHFAAQGVAGMQLLDEAVRGGLPAIEATNGAYRGLIDTTGTLRSELDSLPSEVLTEFGTPGANEAVSRAIEIAQKYDLVPSQVDTFLNQVGFTTAQIEAVKRALVDLDGRFATITKIERTIKETLVLPPSPTPRAGSLAEMFAVPQANGGVLSPRARAFADGGIDEYGRRVDRVPQIRGGQRGVVMWGEPETHWEAYVSGKPGMRERNKGVLAEAASRMGGEVTWYANGAFVEARSESDLTRLRIRIRDLEDDLRKTGDQRLGWMERALAVQELAEARAELRMSEAANRSIPIGHTFESWNTARDRAQSFRDDFDSDAWSTPASLERVLQTKLIESAQFTQALAELKRKGASPWLLEQLIAAGPSKASIRTARQLAQDTARLRRLNALSSQLDQVSGIYGQMTADPRFLQASTGGRWEPLWAAQRSSLAQAVNVRVTTDDPSKQAREFRMWAQHEFGLAAAGANV